MTLVRQVVDDADLRRCLAVRREVFIVGQGVPDEEDVDGKDGEALHFLAEHDGAIVGAARLRFVHDTDAKAERVAVRAPWRGRGIGALLMAEVERVARQRGALTMILAAQITAIPFYERIGYLAKGETFLDAGIEHRWMAKRLQDSAP